MMRLGTRSKTGNSLVKVLTATTLISNCYLPVMALSSSATSSGPPSVQACIVGGGVSGCAAAASLLSGSSLDVMLLEMGRGVGGRASTRFSRDDKRIAINHGAPHADIRTEEGLALMKELESRGFTKPSSFKQQSDTTNQEEENSVSFWTGNPSMNQISEGLLDPLAKKPQFMFGSMVRQVEPILTADYKVAGWRLTDKDGNVLVETEWLLVAGSGMAHPRWTAAFGGEPPLLAAAKSLQSPKLDQALETIGAVNSRPVQTALMAFEIPEEGTAHFFGHIQESGVLETPGDAILEKLVFQKNNGLLSIVAHSNAAVAETSKDTYGSKSTAARVGGATSSADREQEVLGALMEAVKRVLATNNYSSIECPTPSWGPFLHRWGNAFPEGTALAMADAVVEDAKIAFCGDYVGSQERFGTFEGAMISGYQIGKRLQTILLPEA